MAERQLIDQQHQEHGWFIDSAGKLYAACSGVKVLEVAADGSSITPLKALLAVTATLTGDGALAAGVFTAKHAVQMAMRIPSASGIDTDAYHAGLAGCENAGDVTATEASATYCQVYDASATNKYRAIEATGTGDFTQWALLPANTQSTDGVFFGKTAPFCELMLDMSATVQTYTADATTWAYWDGTTWAALTFITDYTDATAQDGKRSFGRDGGLSFVPPADWAACAVNGVTAYWIRCLAGTAANISQVGIVNAHRHYLCAPADSFAVPHACTITRVAIRDEAATVHTAADIKLIVMNFTSGAHSGELTFAQDKRSDAWASLTLACAAGDVLGVLITQEDGTNELGPATIELNATLV